MKIHSNTTCELHTECSDPACCPCSCAFCRNAWEAAGKPTIITCGAHKDLTGAAFLRHALDNSRDEERDRCQYLSISREFSGRVIEIHKDFHPTVPFWQARYPMKPVHGSGNDCIGSWGPQLFSSTPWHHPYTSDDIHAFAAEVLVEEAAAEEERRARWQKSEDEVRAENATVAEAGVDLVTIVRALLVSLRLDRERAFGIAKLLTPAELVLVTEALRTDDKMHPFARAPSGFVAPWGTLTDLIAPRRQPTAPIEWTPFQILVFELLHVLGEIHRPSDYEAADLFAFLERAVLERALRETERGER